VNFYLNINLHNVLAKFFGFLFNFLYSMKLVICYRWAGGFMGWGQQCRLRHVTSGRYLAVTNDNQMVTVHRQKAEEKAVAFFLFTSKV
jgi:hypothetical protein